ncbi:hypothetical protein IG631_14059 [Alternaria alternata]|nr:hypothetical protein IG631_14059 [Alternaria alternata]
MPFAKRPQSNPCLFLPPARPEPANCLNSCLITIALIIGTPEVAPDRQPRWSPTNCLPRCG